VRELTGERRADALSVTGTGPAGPGDDDAGPAGAGWTVTVAHRDGRAWRVGVRRLAAQPPRPESCGAALGTPAVMDVTDVTDVAGRTPVVTG
jgi:hypothetical protein